MPARYDDLTRYPTTIRGREYLLHELTALPTYEEISDRFVLREEETALDWDLLSYAQYQDETLWWSIYTLNQDVQPDPFKPPATIAIPLSSIVQELTRSDED